MMAKVEQTEHPAVEGFGPVESVAGTKRPLLAWARQFWNALHATLIKPPRLIVPEPEPLLPAPGPLERLQRVVLTDAVARTLFEEYASHRGGDRGNEETGWILLGLREKTQAVVLATLPAGSERDAGVAHVQFNSNAQALASRMLRQRDRRLTILGVVHTHPGTLRHPSAGDYEGDILWVEQRRGGDGVFGIGTADPKSTVDPLFAQQPRPHVQCLGSLSFHWYALGKGDVRYRNLPVEVTLGPDLARPLHDVWPLIEMHGERLDRIYRQQAGVTTNVVEGGKALRLAVPLAEQGTLVQLLIRPKEVRYFVVRDGDVFAVDGPADRIDQGIYLLLAELAGG